MTPSTGAQENLAHSDPRAKDQVWWRVETAPGGRGEGDKACTLLSDGCGELWPLRPHHTTQLGYFYPF